MSAVLRETLTVLHRAGSSAGLAPDRAQRVASALESGADAAALAGAGLDARAADASEGADDRASLLADLARADARLEAFDRRLRRAAFYPVTLAASVSIAAGVLLSLALPQFAAIAWAPGVSSSTGGTVAAAVSVLLLLGLAAFVVGRSPGAAVLPAFAALDSGGFLVRLNLLVQAGVDLPAAVRSSSAWLPWPLASKARALAAGLESGQAPGGLSPLLDRFEASMLVGAAGVGAAPAACEALAAARDAGLQRRVEADVVRIQVVSLVLAGLALLAVSATFFWEYSRVLLG